LEGWEGDHEDNEDPRTRTLSSRATSVLLTTGRTRNLAEHGGFSHDDTNVILMLSTEGLSRARSMKAVRGRLRDPGAAPSEYPPQMASR